VRVAGQLPPRVWKGWNGWLAVHWGLVSRGVKKGLIWARNGLVSGVLMVLEVVNMVFSGFGGPVLYNIGCCVIMC